MAITVGYPQTNRKTDTGKTLTRWPVFVDHFTGVIADDSLIDDVRMVRCEVVKGGRLEIIITEMEAS